MPGALGSRRRRRQVADSGCGGFCTPVFLPAFLGNMYVSALEFDVQVVTARRISSNYFLSRTDGDFVGSILALCYS